MVQIDNPRKQFQFNIIIPGLNPFLAQTAKLPDIDFDVTEHGDVGYMVKTAGLARLGKFTVEKIVDSMGNDQFIWDWARQIFNFMGKSRQIPSAYKRMGLVEQYGNDGLVVVKNWPLIGIWPSKINGTEFSRTSSENTIESIEFECDEVQY